MSTESSLSIIAVVQVAFLVVGLGTAIGLIYAIVSFKRAVIAKIDEAFDKVKPVIDSAADVALQAQATVEKVSEKVDKMVTKAAETTDAVGDTVQSVTRKFDEVLSPQVMKAVGVGSAVLKVINLVQSIKKSQQANADVPTVDGGA